MSQHMEEQAPSLLETCVLLRLWRPGGRGLPPAVPPAVLEYLRPSELLLQLGRGVLVVSLETGRALRFFDASKFGNADAILDPAAIYDFTLHGEVQAHQTTSGFELWVGHQTSCRQAGRPQVWQTFRDKTCSTAYSVKPGSVGTGCIAERTGDTLRVHLGSVAVSSTHSWLATAAWRSRQELEITIWDAARGRARGRFTCDGWYQHTFSARSFSMFACGCMLVACGSKAGRGGTMYAAVNVYKITETWLPQTVTCPL